MFCKSTHIVNICFCQHRITKIGSKNKLAFYKFDNKQLNILQIQRLIGFTKNGYF